MQVQFLIDQKTADPDKPLVGCLTGRALVDSGTTLSLSGWKKPVSEHGVAVHIGRDLLAGSACGRCGGFKNTSNRQT